MKNKQVYPLLVLLVSIIILLVYWQLKSVNVEANSNVSLEPDVFYIPGWRQISLTPGMPRLREGSTIAYDSIRGVAVLFGGCSTEALGDTWEWNGVIWTQRFPTNSPSARCFHTMSFDSTNGVIVLFGGVIPATAQLDDTWEWDGNDWTQRLPANSPTTRHSHTMVFDSKRGVTVLY